ncbi:orotate phosphoribosyltransferase [Longibacter salinarum]|uniref:Orotate phosphoribosyltransferase n=1 Tax=Longibacter salinarum TaxID=1850348 RepID=A0A2A8D3K3_9BACT|nr:orotate phosphoribosyltransferase [Longibacter salinarum]PEN15383.1 orotate phosphoribosyltransferase [Longibacter salinarum]
MPDPLPEDDEGKTDQSNAVSPPKPTRSSRLPPVGPPEHADPHDINARRALAADLLQIGAVSLSPQDPYTWSSGMKSPIYCDNRVTLGFPRIRGAIRDGFHRFVYEMDVTPDVVAGTATAGIPHAAWLADRLHLPMAYIRGEAKSHGRKNRIEGIVESGQQVVLVEDLISTGGSALSAVHAIQEAGATVPAVVAIFSYELDKAKQAFDDAGVPLFTLTDFSTLIDVARRENDLPVDAFDSLSEWRKDPEAWSSAHGGA